MNNYRLFNRPTWTGLEFRWYPLRGKLRLVYTDYELPDCEGYEMDATLENFAKMRAEYEQRQKELIEVWHLW